MPTLEQARRFLDTYEAARGSRFTALERAVIYACWVDALAYAARWEHGLGRGIVAGGFQEQLAKDAPPLLGIG